MRWEFDLIDTTDNYDRGFDFKWVRYWDGNIIINQFLPDPDHLQFEIDKQSKVFH